MFFCKHSVYMQYVPKVLERSNVSKTKYIFEKKILLQKNKSCRVLMDV